MSDQDSKIMDVVAENYQLKWHSFSSYLHSCVAMALQNESFADVALVTLDGHQIKAHRFVLSANSKYFHQILKLHPKLTTTLPLMIVLPSEISYKTLQILVQYMYSGEATVSNDVLENVLRGGDILKVKGLYRPKEDEQFDKRGVKVLQKSNNVAVPVSKTDVPSPKPSNSNEPKVLNYTLKVKNFEKNTAEETDANNKTNNESSSSKDTSSNVKNNNQSTSDKNPTTHNENKSSRKANCSEDEESKSNETLEFLVIKEEPIEWSEVTDAEMELLDEKEVFNPEMTIKPEILIEDSHQSPEELYSPLTCELCTETFTVPAEWVRHVQTHTDMLPAKRQRRDKPSEDEENATFPALHCDMCQKFFPTPAEWVHHIQDKHTEFELHLSNKKVPRDNSLNETKQIRQISKLHKVCSECNKVFPSHASMLIHKRTHTGEKPYSCDFCYKGFNVKSNLLRHLRTLHNKIMNPTDVDGKDDDLSD